MKSLFFPLVALVLVGCAHQKPTTDASRDPSQYRGSNTNYGNGDRRDDHRNDRDDSRRGSGWADDNRGGPRGPGGPGSRYGGDRSWRGGSRGGRHCLGCFDPNRFNDVVSIGRENELYVDQHSGAREVEQSIYSPVCGIRSVSIEVLDNEAQVTGLEVHYVGDSYYNWDRLPLQRDWDFRDGSNQGETSMWFDVGNNRRDDRVCIDRIKVTGFTYKDNYYDWKNATVQVYGSRSIRGAGGRPGQGPGPGPGWGGPQGPMGPGPGPMPQTPVEMTLTETVVLAPAVNCIRGIPAAQNPDDIFQDKVFSYGNGTLKRFCDNARESSAKRAVEYRGFTCSSLDITQGRTDSNCLMMLEGKVLPGGIDSKGRPFSISGAQHNVFKAYCSDEIWLCKKTVYR